MAIKPCWPTACRNVCVLHDGWEDVNELCCSVDDETAVGDLFAWTCIVHHHRPYDAHVASLSAHARQQMLRLQNVSHPNQKKNVTTDNIIILSIYSIAFNYQRPWYNFIYIYFKKKKQQALTQRLMLRTAPSCSAAGAPSACRRGPRSR